MFVVMVVEDDPHARKLICAVLERGGYSALPACDGQEALDLLDCKHVDLMIVDLMMPRMGGYELVKTLRDAGYDLPILIATAREALEDKCHGLRLGADDYMVKPLSEEELLLRVAALLRRAKIATERKITVGSTTLDYDAFTVTEGDTVHSLPQKEFLLLFTLLSYPDKIFTRRRIMDELWDMASETDERTVDVHINRLRDRFRASKDFEIVTIRGLGYKAVKRA
ncbi:MAG: response regulator transcription factor [Clostridia bacterium]|nr:response regulator transcription factor [Clostridia bacterium]